ncbi:hypothetical protein CDAR_320171 [Caerostris darwini]|uniref:Uncharacterized protein n=1 Tax=Caerostris darwini TaxID=1538125 RepID=A0AAV4NGQ2_9ARAC|nr:hypothetical protein CDAR_320171 [Caerostris darwini]
MQSSIKLVFTQNSTLSKGCAEQRSFLTELFLFTARANFHPREVSETATSITDCSNAYLPYHNPHRYVTPSSQLLSELWQLRTREQMGRQSWTDSYFRIRRTRDGGDDGNSFILITQSMADRNIPPT